MDNAQLTPAPTTTADGLAKRLFLITLLGVLGYIAVVIALISSAD